jgi:hypothetical protein
MSFYIWKTQEGMAHVGKVKAPINYSTKCSVYLGLNHFNQQVLCRGVNTPFYHLFFVLGVMFKVQ